MEIPEVRYVRTDDDVNIAYQVFGEGAVDLVFVWGWVSNVDLIWDEPRCARFLHQLGSFCRVISFDKRGTGLSDPVDVGHPPHVETRVDDLRAVMDAAGCRRAAVLGFSEGGGTAVMFSAAHPDRVSSLVLYGAFPRVAWAEDYPWGETREQSLRRWAKPLMSGDPLRPEELFPDGVQDPATRRWLRRYLANSASPAMTLALLRMNSRLDVRDILPAVRVPTLVLHRTHDVAVPVDHARYIAEHIPDATLVEYPGADHWPWFGNDVSDDVVQRIERHITGSLHAPLRTGCWRRCCSWTSWGRRDGWPRSVTATGRRRGAPSATSPAAQSGGEMASWSSGPAMGCSRPSPHPAEPSGVPAPSSRTSSVSDCRCAAACTRGDPANQRRHRGDHRAHRRTHRRHRAGG